MATSFVPVEKRLLFSKNDPTDRRLGDIAKLIDANSIQNTASDSFIVVGYPDDNGIEANGGRTGASEAPGRIRNYFYRMTPPAFVSGEPEILDAGDLKIEKQSLSDRHVAARTFAFQNHQRGLRMLSFGGGHDYGFPDAAAYCEAATARGERPLVINFDAHLDVRPMNHGITSGTPFFRLLSEFPETDFVELGLQSQCNSRDHVAWLRARGGMMMFEEERAASGLSLTEALMKLLGDRALTKRSAFLSVDIDAFTSAVAPGASQSWPTGFEPQDFFKCFSWCLGRFDVRGTGIYEVSPRLDVDDRTSRLAALIAHRFVFQL